MDIYRSYFAKKLRVALRDAGFSQTDLANELDVKTSTVSRWANGHDLPKKDRVADICQILKVNPAYFDPSSEDRTHTIKDDFKETMEEALSAALKKRDFRGFTLSSGERISLEDIYEILRDMSQEMRDRYLRALPLEALRKQSTRASRPKGAVKAQRHPKAR